MSRELSAQDGPVPPHDLAAEASVLGALMLPGSGGVAAEVVSLVRPDDFYRGAHKTVYEALIDLSQRGLPSDVVTVSDELERRGHLASAGGVMALADMLAATPTAASAAYHARIVAELAWRRRVQASASRLVRAAGDRAVPVDDAVADAVEAMGRSGGSDGHVDWDRLEEEVFDAHASAGQQLGWGAPWRALERAWRIVPGWVHVVTGFPSAGKSALVDHVIVGLAENHGVRTAVWSPEGAPTADHALRLVGIRAGEPAHRIQAPELVVPLQWVRDHVEFIDHDEAASLPAILAHTQALRDPVQILVVDPFTDVDKWDGAGDEGHDRMLERQLTRLRRWARARQVAVIVVAHPKGIQRLPGGTYPIATISDLHGGAMWRNKIDSAVSVWRDEVGSPTRHLSLVDVHVQKVRQNGRGGEMGRMATLRRMDSGRYFPTVQEVA